MNRKARKARKAWLGAGLLAFTAAIGAIATRGPILGLNLHAVVPGAIYRSAQPDSADLVELAEELGIASVLAVRTARPNKKWYREEKLVTQELGLPLKYLPFHSDEMPARKLLSELIETLDTAPRPLLLHCQAGVERSGLASAVAMLLEGRSLEVARDQFSSRFGYVQWLTGSDLPRVLDRYEAWLAASALDHTPEHFRHWADEVYVAAFYDAGLEITKFLATLRAGEKIKFALRVTNQSPDPIRFRSKKDAGVHISTVLESLDSKKIYRGYGRAGYRDLTLAPGDTHTFKVRIKSVPNAGRYRLTVDLVDESVVFFADMGSQVLVTDLDIGPVPAVAASN